MKVLAAVPVAVAVLVLAGTAAGAVPAAWQRAADRLAMPVLYPASTPNMSLKRVLAQEIACGQTLEQLDGYYSGGANGRRLRVAEAKPFYCGDIGDAEVLAHPTIHGKRATLYDYCEGTGCGKATYRFLLAWREQGIQIELISRGSPRATLYAIARSMTRVADTPGSGGGTPYRPAASARG
jgi:hypothetical protein